MTRSLRIFLVMLASSPAGAQTNYYNPDTGRPTRIDGATAAALNALDIEFPTLRADFFAGGTYRYRTDPSISYGILPFTDIGIRVPIVSVQPPPGSGARAVTGVASVGLDALHGFNLETTGVPAIAIASEVLLPVGNLAPNQRSYIVKGILTKTLPVVRFHLNAGGGTWAVQPTPSSDTICTSLITAPLAAGETACSGGPPIVVDVPCAEHPPERGQAAISCDLVPAIRAASISETPNTSGRRWFAALGADHAFALQSTLISADVVAEHFIGLYSLVDWTAELGIRRQITPTLTLDVGAGRHFAGAIQSTSVTCGATYQIATPPHGHQDSHGGS